MVFTVFSWNSRGLYQHRPQIAKTYFCVINVKKNAPNHSTLQWHPNMAPSVHSPKVPLAPCNGTQQWHPGTQQWHPAPSNGTTPTPPKLVVTLLSGTLQWHPATAPRPLPQSWSSPSPPTIAHYNGTLQWHHVHSPKVGRHPPPQPYHATMAPHESTQQWHHVHCTLQWHPAATSNPPKWFVALPPLLEVRTPIAIAIWGIITHKYPLYRAYMDEYIFHLVGGQLVTHSCRVLATPKVALWFTFH